LSDAQLSEIVNWDLPPVTVSIASLFAAKNRSGSADLNGDGRNETVRTPPGTGLLKIIDGATGQVTRFFPFGRLFRGTLSVALGDFNLDGIADLFVAGFGKKKVRVFSGPDRSLLAAFTTGAGEDRRVAVGELTGDGKLDVVVSVTHPLGSTTV